MGREGKEIIGFCYEMIHVSESDIVNSGYTVLWINLTYELAHTSEHDFLHIRILFLNSERGVRDMAQC